MHSSDDVDQANRAEPPGFSLIELVVALSLSVVVVAIAISLLAVAVRDGKRETARAAMAREAMLAHKLLSDALSASGVGIPRGDSITTADRIYGGVLVAQAQAVGIVGDLPRPGVNFNTLGPLGGRAAATDTAVTWTTANSGPCVPGPDCTTANSLFFPGENGCTGTATDRTCPWGLNRVLPGDWLLIAAGDGSWTYAQANTPALTMSEPNGVGNGWFLDLDAPFAGGAALWPYDFSGPPLSTRGMGKVSTPDRVFFRLQGTDLQRLQCWGRPLPSDADWPPPAQNDLAAFTPADAGAAGETECTGWEIILADVSALSFRYFGETGAEITPGSIPGTNDKEDITRVDWTMTVERTVLGDNVFHEILGSADVRH